MNRDFTDSMDSIKIFENCHLNDINSSNPWEWDFFSFFQIFNFPQKNIIIFSVQVLQFLKYFLVVTLF